MAKKKILTAAIAAWLGCVANVQAQSGPAQYGMPPGYGGAPGYGSPPAYGPPSYGPPGYQPTAYGGQGVPAPGIPPQGLPPAPGATPQGMPPPGTFPYGPPPGMPVAVPPGNAFRDGPPMDHGGHERSRGGWQFHADPFIMWFSAARFPALVTTGDSVNAFVAGAIGEPGTQVLNGGSANVGDAVFGLRLTLVRNFGDDDRGWVDLGGFFTNYRARIFDQQSNAAGSPVLTRPFFNPVAGREDADIRAFPNTFVGTTHDTFTTQYSGMESNIGWEFYQATQANRLGLALLVGGRYFQLNEAYKNFDSAADLPVGTGSTYAFVDDFGARNFFDGGQVGAGFRLLFDRMTADVTTKMIGGVNQQTLNINGYTKVTDVTGATAVDNSQGLFAMPSNVGHWQRDRNSFGGEVGVKLGFRLADCFRFNVGLPPPDMSYSLGEISVRW